MHDVVCKGQQSHMAKAGYETLKAGYATLSIVDRSAKEGTGLKSTLMSYPWIQN